MLYHYLFAAETRDSQVSGNRQHRIGNNRTVRLMQYLTIGTLLLLRLTLGLYCTCRPRCHIKGRKRQYKSRCVKFWAYDEIRQQLKILLIECHNMDWFYSHFRHSLFRGRGMESNRKTETGREREERRDRHISGNDVKMVLDHVEVVIVLHSVAKCRY